MTDFDLGDEAEDADTEASDADPEQASADEEVSGSAPATDVDSEPDPEPEHSTVEDEATGVDPRSTPAFEFEETDQHQIYVRGGTWSDWEKARDGQVKPALVMDDVEDVRKSELQDAALRLVNDHADELPEYVKAARGLDE